jgi:hemerythrin superfamily protein
MARTDTNDAVAVLKADHRAVEQLFRRFERSKSAAERKRLADRIIRELSIHAAVEEQFVYPVLRRRLDGDDGQVLVALEEHHATKLSLSEIEPLRPGDERFEPKVRVLIANVRRHVAEEERDLLPALRRAVSPEELRAIGETIVQAKAAAPTRPHPTAPDEPPGNLIGNVGAAVVDRSRDAIGRGIGRMLDRSRGMVEEALRRGEQAARDARQRLGRGIERVGRDVRPDSH